MKNETVMDNVKTMRDELKLKSHLFKMEAKEKWDDLEAQYESTVAKMDKAKSTLGEVKDDLKMTNKIAFKKIKEGYEQIKKDLDS